RRTPTRLERLGQSVHTSFRKQLSDGRAAAIYYPPPRRFTLNNCPRQESCSPSLENSLACGLPDGSRAIRIIARIKTFHFSLTWRAKRRIVSVPKARAHVPSRLPHSPLTQLPESRSSAVQ